MATKYIAPAPLGSNSNAGTLASPWLTPAYAHANSSSGDIIILLPGTYTLLNGANYYDRTWQGYTPDPSLYVLDGLNAGVFIPLSYYSTTFINITFTNVAAISGTPTFGNYWAYSVYTNIIFNSCIFRNFNNPHLGIIGSSQNGGVITTTLTGCLIYNNTGYFTIQYNSNITMNLYNCTFYNQYITDSYNHTIVAKNTIFHTVTWNIIYPSPIAYSCCFYNSSGSSLWTLHNCITSDPQFVDLSERNFRLRPNSPCIGAGTLV